MLARSAARKKELAIRIALGAGRLRIICQLLTEGLVIAVLGGAFGLLLTCWGINFIRANLNFNDAISAIEFKLDWNVLLFTLTISIICALLCGLAPSLKASRTDSNSNLKEEGRGSSPSRSFSRLRTIMVTAELALALVLLIGTGLLLRGISLIDHQYLGFRSDHLLTADVTLDSARYKDSSERILFVQNLLARLQQIPGAQSAAVTSDLPATGPGSVTLDIKGQPELPANQKLSALDVVITPGYFSAADIPLLRGRTFTEMDNFSAPRVVVVNQEFVRLDLHGDLHGEDPVGKQIRLDVIGGAPSWSEIVGVVANVKTYSEETRDDPQVYEPFLQRTVPSFSLMLRTSSDPNNSASALRESVAQVDSELPVARLMSMTALIERQKAGNPFFLRVLSCFAVLALILSAIGIYGLIAYSVGQRTHELGIRMALGATSRTVLRMILLQGVKMSVIGAAIGLVLSLPLPKVFESLFYGLHFGESRTYFIVPLAIIAVATLATYIPARRATRIDPIIALRHE
jgi:putative ABC transport system permease protein